jgi:uncharacterized protein (TIGR03435 family)
LPAAATLLPWAGAFESINLDGPDGFEDEKPHGIDSITDTSLEDATVDEFCHMLEQELDRPVVNETKLDGSFDFQVREPDSRRRSCLSATSSNVSAISWDW